MSSCLLAVLDNIPFLARIEIAILSLIGVRKQQLPAVAYFTFAPVPYISCVMVDCSCSDSVCKPWPAALFKAQLTWHHTRHALEGRAQLGE